MTINNIGHLPIPVYLEIIYQDDSKEELYKTASVWKNGDDSVVHSYPPGHLIRDNFVSKRRIRNA